MDIPTQLAIKQAKINVLSDLVEMSKDKAYAIGMATVKRNIMMKPLDKKTKAHEIGDKLSKMKNEEHPSKEIYETLQVLKRSISHNATVF